MVKIDPRTKIFILIIINIVTFSTRGEVADVYLKWVAAAIPIVLMLCEGKVRTALGFAVLYLVIQNVGIVYQYISTASILGVLFSAMVGLVGGMGPSFMMAYYMITTTNVSVAIAAMERLHLSLKIIIPFTVLFRFFPTIGEEYRSIKDAMRMRGITLRRGPIAILEYRFIPLMTSIVKTGEELSAAALTRGLDQGIRRTNMCNVRFSIFDVLFGGIASVIVVIYLLEFI